MPKFDEMKYECQLEIVRRVQKFLVEHQGQSEEMIRGIDSQSKDRLIIDLFHTLREYGQLLS